MLDNGYVYLAATRLTLFRSSRDWALVIEVFGFSPRSGIPHTSITTFGSHPHEDEDTRFIHPIEPGDWQDDACDELVVPSIDASVTLRSERIPLPTRADYADVGIRLDSAEQVEVFELCRYLAERHRPLVLATADELRLSVMPQMAQLLQLDAWHHPNVADGERPSGSETFRQLARVLETGDVAHYRPTHPPNIHWSNWPEGGTL